MSRSRSKASTSNNSLTQTGDKSHFPEEVSENPGCSGKPPSSVSSRGELDSRLDVEEEYVHVTTATTALSSESVPLNELPLPPSSASTGDSRNSRILNKTSGHSLASSSGIINSSFTPHPVMGKMSHSRISNKSSRHSLASSGGSKASKFVPHPVSGKASQSAVSTESVTQSLTSSGNKNSYLRNQTVSGISSNSRISQSSSGHCIASSKNSDLTPKKINHCVFPGPNDNCGAVIDPPQCCEEELCDNFFEVRMHQDAMENMEGTLKKIQKDLERANRRFRLHEDNIDELQERLYLCEFGTPGTFMANVKFYLALFKCVILPLIVIEVLYRVLYGG